MTEQLAKSVTSKLIVCPKCGENVLEHRLKKHLKKVHSPEREFIQKEKHLEQLRTQAEQNRLVVCPVCNTEVKINNLPKHLQKVHGLDNLNAQKLQASRKRVPVPLPSVINAGAQHNLAYSDHDRVRSNGIFVSGGAVGLGKRR